MHSIEGKVVYKDGTPMQGRGQVLFNPVDPGKNTSARGEINEDGTFRMGTLAENDGVHEGRYRIAVVPAPPRNPDRPPANWPPVSKKYTNPETSELEITVTGPKKGYEITVAK